MDMSTQIPMVGYFIYRSSEQADPTALEFCPPKGSDELFFALKTAFPHVKTHSDRMRNAVIEFLKQELNDEQSQMTTPVIPLEADLSYDVPTESPWWPSMDSTASTLSSPDLFNMATPASMSSSHAPTMSRQNSSSQPSTTQKAKPGLEEMTGVFSLSSTSQPKTRVRRKMTEAEKLEYRKRRIVKACESCSKRKRKCSHNQPEMEKLRSSKVTKPRATTSNINLACVEQIEKAIFQPAEPSIVDEDPFMFLNQNMFSELPTTDDFIFDNATIAQAPQQTAWPWSETADWTLIDTPLLAQASPSSPTYQQALFPASSGLLSPQQTPQLELIHEPAEQGHSELPTTTQTPTRTWRTFSEFSRTAFSTADGRDGKEHISFMGLSSPGDMVSPTQSRNVYSTTATLTGTSSSFSLGGSAISSGSDEMLSQFVPQAYELTENACRSEASQPRGTSGGIAATGHMGGLSQVISQQASNGQAGAAHRHVLTGNNATSPTRTLGDQYIGNSSGARSTAAIAEGGLQSTARTLLPAASSAGPSLGSLNASGQLPTANAKVDSQGLSSTMNKQPAAAASVHHESIVAIKIAASETAATKVAASAIAASEIAATRITATGETPSAARPSSMSADSTSTSSSSSMLRTVPASPRPRSQAASPDLHGGLSAAASTPLAAIHTNAFDENAKKPASANKVHLEEGEEEISRTQREQSRRLPLKAGARTTQGHSSTVATSASGASVLASSQTAAPQAAATTEQLLRRHRHKRSSGQSLATATSADLGREGTRLAAAILVAQVCAAWQAVAGAFVQTMSTTRASCGSNDRDLVSVSVPRAVLLAA
ncbi:hypothetical protein QM012_005295 [Aureobasidium pullulans]|uniref:BZIP domain-containing protein n=1 Tax=Aureobasidium pullulans TaxID=5580 RepID=A0ABR0T595_AURPU